MAREHTRTGPPLWLGLLILVVAPFAVLAAVIHRAPTLGTPAGAFTLHTGQSFVSNGDNRVVYLPTSQSDRSCWLFDANDRVLAAQAWPDSLQTDLDGVAYRPMVAYRAEPGTVIVVSCEVDADVPILVSPPISRRSAVLPVVVGGTLGFALIGCGAVMLFSRKRALQQARLADRFGT